MMNKKKQAFYACFFYRLNLGTKPTTRLKSKKLRSASINAVIIFVRRWDSS